MNQPQPQDAATSSHASVSTRNYADEEDNTIRVKSLSDLTLPHPPKDAAQARGYVNQVLMSIGKLQKTHGHEVYAWAQECLTHDEAVLKADPRFPRTDREIAAKLIKTCRTGRFGILFQQMVESERAESGGMPCGRVMLRLIFKHFQLERDRIGMLGERNLLQLKVPGKNVSDLEAFKQKYDYILQTIPHADLPREQTLFNHLIDELEKSPIMAYKVQKAREAPLGSHRRTTAWLWEKVDLAIELEQQKKNRADFDRQLQLKPQDGYSGTAEVTGAPAPTGAAKTKKEKAAEKAERDRKEKEAKDKEKKKKEKEAAKAAALAAAAAGRPNPKGGPKPPPKAPKPGKGDTTPRGQEVTKAAQMTPAEKAKTPCMFYAYGVCKAKSCAFLHSDTHKYKGPPPRVLGKAPKGKAPAKVAASVAPLVSAPLSHSSTDVPQVNALPIQLDHKVPWLWDTAAGRHIIGRQALSSDMKSCLRKSVSPVAFATGGGSQPGQESLGFTGSKILEGEEVYVLKECPPAQSIGKTVVDKGYLFVWDPSESVPYLVAPQDIKRCRLRVPRNARICASRVVEYVPQYDETIEPVAFNQGSRMVPTPTAIPAESEEVPKDSPPAVEEYKVPSIAEEMPLDDDVSPSIADAEGPNLEDVAEVGEASEPSGSKEGGAASGAPGDKGHPLDDVPLADLADGEPLKDEVLKKEAESLEHMLTHFPKNPFCRICNVAKNTSRNVARKPDSKDDDFIDPPKEVFEQLATDDVILAKGSEHMGVGIGGIRSHHVIRDVKSGARLAYPLSKRDAQAHARNFRHFIGLKANEVTTRTLIKMDEAGELEQAAHLCGMTPETSMPNRWPHNAVLERDVREEKECCRSVHLQSGLPYEFHTFSYPYACLSMTFDRKALADASKTQWEMITKSPFEGRRLCFGQLVFFRKKSATRRTLEPNMSPGLFLGWRIDPGLRYRGVLRVLDYQEYRTKKNALAVDVPQEELFSAPTATSQRKANKNNRRKRKADQKSQVPGPKSTVFEFACAVDSQMGQTNEEMNINHIRLCREHINLCDEESCAQLDYQIRAAAESAPPHMWGALPCTSGSPWQYINSIRGGERFKVHLNKMILTSKKLFKSFVKRAELVLSLGGTVTFEWPRHNSGWNRPDVRRFFEQHPEFQSVEFDGCLLGLKSKDNRPIKKPWKLMTTDPRIKAAFQGYLCTHQPHEHDKCEGAETSRSAFYPQQMTMLIAKTWFPERFINRSPAMPCGVVSQLSEHREKEQELKHISSLSGLETFAAELETDPTANNIVGQLLDVNTLLADSLKIQHPGPDSDINAMVTKLLSRSEMLASPEALSAVRKEAEGLEHAGTWDLKSVREHADVRSEAKKTGISVHFGQLMTIASIKFFE